MVMFMRIRLLAFRPRLALLLTIALLWSSLLPWLGMTSAPNMSPVAEVCTADGLSRFALDQDHSSAPEHSGPHEVHCPLCLLPGHMPLTASPAACAWIAPSHLANEVPSRFLSAPRSAHVWLSAQPRAPPVPV